MRSQPAKLTEMRQHAEQIFRAGLRAVEPHAAIMRCCDLQGERLRVGEKIYDLTQFERILVLGAGKAGAVMAQAVEDLLGDRIDGGLVVVKYDHLADVRKVAIREAGHPVPDENGEQAAGRLLDLAAGADQGTLVIFLVSGGGSALLPMPAAGISLADKQATTRTLLACGATIHEINALRKHLSGIKGGQLARAVFPATLVALVLSDVVGDDLDTIASGPCVPDRTTFADCLRIVEKYQIEDKLPDKVMSRLRAGADGELEETPKQGDPAFDRTFTFLVGRNFDALAAAHEKAASFGYESLILSSLIEGEARDVAAMHVAIAREILQSGHPLQAPACILSGGECTVTIKGSGLGGRNQEFALAAADLLDRKGSIVLLSAGTDGSDGPTDAAGAFADSSTLARAEALGLDLRQALQENDSYHLFAELGDLFKTGPTNTNVMDLRILLIV
ncbi:MAG TPA: glycerate kinase [Desulfuromonadales bacterium]|nr:glycerate kinase [Desulfuromonadales bacterium]